jgi:hypothetical protein
MRRFAVVISALAVAALAAVALAGPPFDEGNNPAQDCKNDAGPPAGRAFGECVSTKARALHDSAGAAAARHSARHAAAEAHRASRAKDAGETHRKAPFAKGDNPAQHCKNEPGPPTGRAFGECVSDYARSLNPSAGKPEDAGQGRPENVPEGPPAERPPAPVPESAPQANPPQGPPTDTPAGPPTGLPGPPSGGPPDHP